MREELHMYDEHIAALTTAIVNLNKKIDKVLNQQTRIAKTLHLIPVTEKEERDIYATRLKNSEARNTLLSELNSKDEKAPSFVVPSLSEIFKPQEGLMGYDYFSDVLADDLNISYDKE